MQAVQADCGSNAPCTPLLPQSACTACILAQQGCQVRRAAIFPSALDERRIRPACCALLPTVSGCSRSMSPSTSCHAHRARVWYPACSTLLLNDVVVTCQSQHPGQPGRRVRALACPRCQQAGLQRSSAIAWRFKRPPNVTKRCRHRYSEQSGVTGHVQPQVGQDVATFSF